jgi:hypothetical protein
MNGKKGKHASGVAVWFQTFLKKKESRTKDIAGHANNKGSKSKEIRCPLS